MAHTSCSRVCYWPLQESDNINFYSKLCSPPPPVQGKLILQRTFHLNTTTIIVKTEVKDKLKQVTSWQFS